MAFSRVPSLGNSAEWENTMFLILMLVSPFIVAFMVEDVTHSVVASTLAAWVTMCCCLILYVIVEMGGVPCW